MIFFDELLSRALVFLWQGFGSFLLAYAHLYQFAVHHYEVEYTFLATMEHMNVYGLVLVGVEVKINPKYSNIFGIVKTLLVSDCKLT